MTVEQITNLRRTLMKKDAAYRVVKNRFAKIALTELNNQADKQLVGPTAIALVRGDEANVVAKELFASPRGSPIQVKVQCSMVSFSLLKRSRLSASSRPSWS
jgi:large subunit ribosomal protein L10